VPVAAGLYALLTHQTFGWLLFAAVPGALTLMSGGALLLMPGERRITGFMALGGALGVLMAIPLWFAGGFGAALTATALFAGAFVVAGRLSLHAMPSTEEVPQPLEDWKLDAKVGFDEALLAYFLGSATLPSGEAARRMCGDALELGRELEMRGWIENPDLLHTAPPPCANVRVSAARIFGHDYEQLSCESSFLPPTGLPGAAEWSGFIANRSNVANVLRYPGGQRHWLLCIHGYRMGLPYTDFSMFQPQRLHRELGLNVLMPILPLHGSRKIGLRTGDRYLDGNLLDLLYAQTQALWDIRSWIAWIREQDPSARIGIYGVSLGGYNAALLPLFDEALDFVVAGVPVVDFAGLLWRFIPSAHRQFFADSGLDEARYRSILRVVSPMERVPKMPAERLHLVGAVADRVVPPAHSVRLSHHWNVPVTWYQGSHLSLRREEEPGRVLAHAVREAGWLAGR